MREVMDWLLEGDAAIVFQVHRDLLDAPAARCRSLQARVANEGWGARLLSQRDRNGRYSPYAHWKAAWLTYRSGKKEDARKLLEEQLSMYPASGEVPAALYWRGRLAEADGDQPLARALRTCADSSRSRSLRSAATA